jgi:hypothetical protein
MICSYSKKNLIRPWKKICEYTFFFIIYVYMHVWEVFAKNIPVPRDENTDHDGPAAPKLVTDGPTAPWWSHSSKMLDRRGPAYPPRRTDIFLQIFLIYVYKHKSLKKSISVIFPRPFLISTRCAHQALYQIGRTHAPLPQRCYSLRPKLQDALFFIKIKLNNFWLIIILIIYMLSIMHVISLDLYFKVLLCDANFIFVENITWNKLMVKVCHWRSCKKI